MKQNSTTLSPPLSTGKNDRGKCTWKYATAISPASRNATGRVKTPSRIARPPNVSSTPASPNCDISVDVHRLGATAAS